MRNTKTLGMGFQVPWEWDGPSGLINSSIPVSPQHNVSLSQPTLNDLSGDGVERLDVGVARPDAVHHRQAEPPVPANE